MSNVLGEITAKTATVFLWCPCCQEPQHEVHGATGEHPDRVWTASELAVLHALQTAVVVIVYGLFDCPHRFVFCPMHSSLA